MTGWLVLDVTDDSSIGEARRACARLASSLAFDESTAGRVAIVVTELASNLVKHGVASRRLFARTLERGEQRALEVVAVDRGPGIGDVGRALSDGFSTAGTPGTGLGAVRRLSDEFDFHTQPGHGTALVARIAAPPNTEPVNPSRLETGVFMTPYPGETVCGDGWLVLPGETSTTIVVTDGLGHGIEAAEASAAAVAVASRLGPDVAPAEHLAAMHEALHGTRGAAVAVANVDVAACEITFTGVGNISAVLTSGGATRSLVTLDGITGHASPRMRQFDYPFPDDAVLVMHSDGVGTRWQLDTYPGLAFKDPALIAAVVHRDAARGRDDAVVVAAARATRRRASG